MLFMSFLGKEFYSNSLPKTCQVTLFGRLFDNVINYSSATLDKVGP